MKNGTERQESVIPPQTELKSVASREDGKRLARFSYGPWRRTIVGSSKGILKNDSPKNACLQAEDWASDDPSNHSIDSEDIYRVGAVLIFICRNVNHCNNITSYSVMAF
jgi:hypothetical protein